MTIYDLKPVFQNLLRPICNSLAKAGVTANQVTVAATLMSVFVGLLFALFPTSRWAALLIPVSLFVRMAVNAIDGMLAREHNMQSDLGGVLNELGDVVSDAARTRESKPENSSRPTSRLITSPIPAATTWATPGATSAERHSSIPTRGSGSSPKASTTSRWGGAAKSSTPGSPCPMRRGRASRWRIVSPSIVPTA